LLAYQDGTVFIHVLLDLGVREERHPPGLQEWRRRLKWPIEQG
jgi:hypothetical protein